MPGFTKEIEQNDRQGDAEGRGEDSHSLRVQRVFEGVSKQVEPAEQEEHGQKADQASESPCQTSANDQRFHNMMGGYADESFSAHRSSLAGNLSYGSGILDTQKLEIGKAWRRVFLLHRSAADAPRITSIDITARFNQDFAVTCRIHAVPVFSCFS
jgi:hypothetical protein